VDGKLRWSTHIAQAAQKGNAQMVALSRLTGSTWDLTFGRARTLYTEVIRPTITYGCGVWAGGEKAKVFRRVPLGCWPHSKNKCLRYITGAYKRTTVVAPEKGSDTSSIQLYTNVEAYGHVLNTDQFTAEVAIRQRCEHIGPRGQTTMTATTTTDSRRTPGPGRQRDMLASFRFRHPKYLPTRTATQRLLQPNTCSYRRSRISGASNRSQYPGEGQTAWKGRTNNT